MTIQMNIPALFKEALIKGGSKAFIIAEIGSNWKTKADCIHSIESAARYGANAVKFQLYTAKELYGPNSNGPIPGELPSKWLEQLKKCADINKIDFMCTAFSEKGFDRVDKYVRIHKIASAEMDHPVLFKKAKESKKPVLFSTGGAAITQIERIDKEFIALYCVGEYPAKAPVLKNIEYLNKIFLASGYSDHTIDNWTIPIDAVHRFGAKVLEKHVNFTGHADTPDAPHSMNESGFEIMMSQIRNPFDGYVEPIDEKDMICMHKRRLVATKDIRPGNALKYGRNFGIFRLKKKDYSGLGGCEKDNVEGLIVDNEIKKGKCIERKYLRA